MATHLWLHVWWQRILFSFEQEQQSRQQAGFWKTQCERKDAKNNVAWIPWGQVRISTQEFNFGQFVIYIYIYLWVTCDLILWPGNQHHFYGVFERTWNQVGVKMWKVKSFGGWRKSFICWRGCLHLLTAWSLRYFLIGNLVFSLKGTSRILVSVPACVSAKQMSNLPFRSQFAHHHCPVAMATFVATHGTVEGLCLCHNWAQRT